MIQETIYSNSTRILGWHFCKTFQFKKKYKKKQPPPFNHIINTSTQIYIYISKFFFTNPPLPLYLISLLLLVGLHRSTVPPFLQHPPTVGTSSFRGWHPQGSAGPSRCFDGFPQDFPTFSKHQTDAVSFTLRYCWWFRNPGKHHLGCI